MADFFTPHAAAAKHGIPVTTIYRWIGETPGLATRIGGRYAIDPDTMAALVASRAPSPLVADIRRRVAALPWTIRVHACRDAWIISGREKPLTDPWFPLGRLQGCSFEFAQLLWPFQSLARDLLVERCGKGLSLVSAVVGRWWREIDGHEPLAVVEEASPEVREFVDNAFHDAKALLDLEPAAVWGLLHGGGVR